jgi:hypothetical protein
MAKKFFLAVIAIGLIIWVIGEVLIQTSPGGTDHFDPLNAIKIGRFIAFSTAVLMLLAYGTYYKTKKFRVSILFTLLLLVGVLFKLLHWEYAGLNGMRLILIGHSGALFLYSWHFLTKKPKIRLDFLKVFFVLLYGGRRIGFLFDMVDPEIVAWSDYFLWVVFIDFLITDRKKEKYKSEKE